MQDSARSPLVDTWSLRLEREIEHANFGEPRGSNAYSSASELDRTRQDAREVRLDEAEPFVPPLLWVALIAGAVLLLAYVCSFANPAVRLPLQLGLVAAVATIATLNLCVVRFLDHPYADVPGGLKPARMQEALTTMETQGAGRSPGLRPPCDQIGRMRAASAVD
jgi:hypothetical protein